MRKILAIILILTLSLSLFSCSGKDGENNETTPTETEVTGQLSPTPTEAGQETVTSAPAGDDANSSEAEGGSTDDSSKEDGVRTNESDTDSNPTLIPEVDFLDSLNYASNFNGSPITSEELMGSWEITGDSIMEIIKSGLYYELEGDLSLENVIEYMYDNHEDIEEFIDGIDSARVYFTEQECYAIQNEDVWKYVYELTPNGVNMIDTEMDDIFEFTYDKENQRLILRVDDIVYFFYKNLNAEPYVYEEREDDLVEPTKAPEEDEDENNEITLNVWSYNPDLSRLIEEYIRENPKCGIKIISTIIGTIDGVYDQALETNLVFGGKDMPDIYGVDAAIIAKTVQGTIGKYSAAYEDLGIDVASKLEEADIAPYASQVGTRPGDSQIVALPFSGNGVSFIYRRSIARDVFGTDNNDDIEQIIGGGTGSWDSFWYAAEKCKNAGCAIVPSAKEIWPAYAYAPGITPWVVNGKLNIDKQREAFLDIAKLMFDKNYEVGAYPWTEEWFKCMNSDSKVFGFFGPSWLIEYTMLWNTDATDDWGICCPPTGGIMGGTYILANGALSGEKKEAVAKLVEWLTLDATESGAQYKIATGTAFSDSIEDIEDVASGKVKDMLDIPLEFLGNQNPFPVWKRSGELAVGNNITPYDETIDGYFKECAISYAKGDMTRQEALEWFKECVESGCGIKAK